MLKPFITRILDAPTIQRVGRRQFCVDLGFILDIFPSPSPCRSTMILEELRKVLQMEQGQVENVRDAIMALVDDAGGDGWIDEMEQKAAFEILEAKGKAKRGAKDWRSVATTVYCIVL